jgi:hypothetical protein
MADFTEHTMIQDNISMWTFNKKDEYDKKQDIIYSKTLKKYYIYTDLFSIIEILEYVTYHRSDRPWLL